MGQSIRNLRILFPLVMLFLPSPSLASMLIGGETNYTVVRGDTLELIGARMGVNWWKIAKDNTLDAKKRLQVGQKLQVSTLRIVPVTIDNGIIINVPDKTLYYFKDGMLSRSFPVGLGMLASKSQKDWKTPLGRFRVVAKEKNPTWFVPRSIQEEMALEGKEVKAIVPPGPDNPLGRYALKTTMPGIMLHETIKPASVNQFRSHGCIRVHAEHMEKFFEEVESNASGELIYMPVKAAISDDGRVFLEVHRDFYHRIRDMREEAKSQLEKTGALKKVDWQKVEKILKERSGIAEDVTL
jgi:L,D-transpeptidase ErfK/SrfK